MSVINSIPLIAAGDDGYQISRSVRLRSSASGYFSKNQIGTGNGRTWTYSGWVKRGALTGTSGRLLCTSAGVGNTNSLSEIYFDSNDKLVVFQYTASTTYTNLVTTQVFRDPSAWYHIVVAYNDTQVTSTDRIKVYVNGVQITAFSTAVYPTQNFNSFFNTSTNPIWIGPYTGNSYYLDGYLAELNFIDGQALTPSSFGETDAVTGVWKPKKYAGTYGTNGFYLNFSDPSAATAAAIGKDYSGNGNNWTSNNISVTAGVTYDSMIDTPTPYADGGNGRGNYATLNPLARRRDVSTLPTFSDGNLKVTFPNAAGSATYAMSSIGVESGKWYWEIPVVTRATEFVIGIGSQTVIDGSAGTRGYQATTGTINGFTSNNGPGATYTSGDIIGIALDVDAGTCAFYKNNVLQATGTGLGFTTIHPFIQGNTSDVANANFGQRPFAYTPPTGFKALNTQNLPESTIVDGGEYFNPVLYTGNATARSITGVGFQPDFVWTKSRSGAESHRLYDSVRGATKSLYSNLTNAEATEAQSLTAFGSDGFSLGTGAPNSNAVTYAAWNWKESATAGFDIVTYTGDGNYPRNISHGLGVTPAMVIYKARGTPTSFPAGGNWIVWHKAISQAIQTSSTFQCNTFTGATYLNATNASSTYGADNQINGNGTTFVAYCFAEVPGFSKFGSYTGNGSADGPFVFCGFRPAFVMVKASSTTGSWVIIDASRNTYNVSNNALYPNLSSAETTDDPMDFLSNGFKFRTSGGDNASGSTYIFAAFAEHPFKNALAR